MNKPTRVHSQDLLKLIAIEFKECLMDSPSFRASINYKIKEIKGKFIDVDYNAFTLENLDSWCYSNVIDNQVIKIYHNNIRNRMPNTSLLDKEDIRVIHELVKTIDNYIIDFEHYDQKLNDLIMKFTSTNHRDDQEFYKKDAMHLYTLKIKHLNNALNLIHESKIMKVNLNILTMKIILKLYEKSIQADDCLIYSDTLVKLENLIQNFIIMHDSQQVLKTDININKNLIIKSFKENYDPEQLFSKYNLKNFNDELIQNKFRDYDLYEFKGWFFEIKDGLKSPKFLFIKKNIFGVFEVSQDGTYVTETDKFGINLVKFKVLDLNNEENGYKKFSFKLTFKSSDSEESFDVVYQSISSFDICKIHSVIMNMHDDINKKSLSSELMEISNRRFPPLFREFFIEDRTSPLINVANKDSISILKRLEKYENDCLTASETLRILNTVNMPCLTSMTNMAMFANVYITLSTNFVPNAIIANTWGSSYWTNLFMKNDDDFSYFSQLYVKTQSDSALTMHNVPFKMLFGYMKEERGCLSMNCFLYFPQTPEAENEDVIYFKGSIFATHKKLYFYLNSYGLFSLLTIPLEDILDIKLIRSEGELEPLKMIIYDKKQLNIAIKINFTQYRQLKEEYDDGKNIKEFFDETISLLSLKEKILYLIDANSQHLQKQLDKSIFNQRRSVKEDDDTRKTLHKIDYKYYKKYKEQDKTIVFKQGAVNGVQIKDAVEDHADITNDIYLDNGIDPMAFKTDISTKHTWAKLHKLEVPISFDSVSLLFLGRKNVFASNLFTKIYQVNSKKLQDDEGIDDDSFSWAKKESYYIRQYLAILREKKVFTTDKPKLYISELNTNEIVVNDILLQYIPDENLLLKMELGSFDIPFVGLVSVNNYFIIEKVDSVKTKITFYFELLPAKEIVGTQYMKRLIFEILKNYLYKKHLKSLVYFKHALARFYKTMGSADDQFINCLKISSTVEIEKDATGIIENDISIKIIRTELLKMIIKHYLIRSGINTVRFLRKIYLIAGAMITNILLINRTLMLLLIASCFLNSYLLGNDFFKTWFMARKMNSVMNNEMVVQRSLSINDFDALVEENLLTVDKNNRLLNNFMVYTLDKTAYQDKKKSFGIERNDLLITLDTLKRRELKLMKEEYDVFIRNEAHYCMQYEKNVTHYGNHDLKSYCDSVEESYMATQLL